MLSALPQRARALLLGAFGAVAAFFVFGGARTRGGSIEPLDAVPRDAFIVATVNAAELRRSPLYELLFGAGERATGAGRTAALLGARALGMGGLADACGFEPLSRVERLALAVPEHGDKGELGVAARVDMSRDELSRCASALAGVRGGTIATKEVGRFTVVDAPSSDGATTGARIAYGQGGLLVVGRGGWFDAMLAAGDGRAPRAKDAALGADDAGAHAALRSSLTARDGWRTPTALVTIVVPASLRARVKGDMASELSAVRGGAPGVAEADRTMAGVLGVSAAGVALRTGARGQTIDLVAELACDADEACAAVEALLLDQRLRWSKELTLRLVGLGPLLDSIDVKREGSRVRISAGAASDQLVEAVGRVLRLRARPGDAHGSGADLPAAPDAGAAL